MIFWHRVSVLRVTDKGRCLTCCSSFRRVSLLPGRLPLSLGHWLTRSRIFRAWVVLGWLSGTRRKPLQSSPFPSATLQPECQCVRIEVDSGHTLRDAAASSQRFTGSWSSPNDTRPNACVTYAFAFGVGNFRQQLSLVHWHGTGLSGPAGWLTSAAARGIGSSSRACEPIVTIAKQVNLRGFLCQTRRKLHHSFWPSGTGRTLVPLRNSENGSSKDDTIRLCCARIDCCAHF